MRNGKVLVLVAGLLVALSAVARGRVITRCELANEILRHNVSVGLVKHWVCLAESESYLTTDRVGENADLSSNYGIFQINQYWCGDSRNPDKCDVKCEDLLNEDLYDDFECALKIYRKRRFSAWDGWRKGCKGVHLENVSTC
ncbi:lysozyme c-1-like [Schistocerca americana]|uniref:lysozyme c-1-like n=1 Tax=Schistocerca americana TaxID=7009 RepID=UPI001F500A83|nr:lysozyme c-1-like [Schistocerca americana]